ncbi:hypothetical protein KOW79_017324 [Hemibagrus wyckioides]|uniref:Uncharacterized protein n=1 Tax=Hemibagrus wyckioides TaxID=337641 RepID=A0A9D3NAZ9_9TELE|nr:hypothetical protein KOW79_017324 [Hemibagrus wyckioides]
MRPICLVYRLQIRLGVEQKSEPGHGSSAQSAGVEERSEKAQKTSMCGRLAGRLCFAVIKWHLLSFCCQTSLALGYRRENPQFGTKKPLMLQQ